MTSTTENCPHTHQMRVIDKLGPMRERDDGVVKANVLEWSVICSDCMSTLMVNAEVLHRWRWRLSAEQIAYCWGGGAAESPTPGKHRARMSLIGLARASRRRKGK